ESQVLYITGRDLIERAITPSFIITTDHEPIARVGMQQHFVRDWQIILHFASHGQPLWPNLNLGEASLILVCLVQQVAQSYRHLTFCDRSDPNVRTRAKQLRA